MKQFDKFEEALQRELNYEFGGRIVVSGFYSNIVTADVKICLREQVTDRRVTVCVEGFLSEEFWDDFLEGLFKGARAKATKCTLEDATGGITFIMAEDVIRGIIREIKRQGTVAYLKDICVNSPIAKFKKEELFEIVKEAGNWKPNVVTRIEHHEPDTTDLPIDFSKRLVQDRIEKLCRAYVNGEIGSEATGKAL